MEKVTVLTVVLLQLFLCIHGQQQQQGCCGLQLMDASGQTVLESQRILPPATYLAASVRTCGQSADAMAIQVWSTVSANTFQLKWQTVFTPTNSGGYTTVVFPATNTLSVTTGDRLGLFIGTSLGTSKLPVPFDTNASSSVILSQTRFNSTGYFSAGLQVTFATDVAWPRTFVNNIKLCTTQDCSDQPTTPTTPSSSVPTTGSSVLPPCGCPSTCSADAVLLGSIGLQNDKVKLLQDEINRLQTLISSLQSSNAQTGYCRPGYIPGVYGLGSCYKVVRSQQQQGVASMKCRLDQANLVEIDSDIEQRFLFGLLASNTSNGIESFWTSAMFNPVAKQWSWYQSDYSQPIPIGDNSYRAWYLNIPPTPLNDVDVCVQLSIDNAQNTIYWQKNDCTTLNSYVCEVSKICY